MSRREPGREMQVDGDDVLRAERRRRCAKELTARRPGKGVTVVRQVKLERRSRISTNKVVSCAKKG